MLIPFARLQRWAMVWYGGLIAAAVLVRALVWMSAPDSTRRETELIFIFLAVIVLLNGLLFLRYVSNRAVTAGAIAVGALLLCSAIGALVRSLGAEPSGGKAPIVFFFQRPVPITAAAGDGGRDEVRVEMVFRDASGTSLEKRFKAVALGELQLYLRVPSLCGAGSCEMWVVHPETGELVSATRRPYEFEVRFRDGHPFVLDVSAPLTLVFAFSGDITLYARDIGRPSSARSDRLVHRSRELALPYDHLIFARFMFVDMDGKPHSAIY